MHILPIEAYIIRQYHACADDRKIPFMLTDDQVIAFFDLPCVYCGAEHTNTAKRKQYKIKFRRYNGIDRLNSAQGYTVSNTVSCCKQCNRAKSDMSATDFLNSAWLALRIETMKG